MTPPLKLDQNPTFIKLAQVLAETTGVDVTDIYPNSSIHDDFVMNPVEYSQFLTALRLTFPGLTISRADLEECDTVYDVADFIEDSLS
ncbi:hypothetical protein C5B42_04920 [Candidatus Cerribacteria bacterium 'Amazon FNV 2010 28 9']|uniref:Carrier domain-containing protein n=1 Tax=Candidatus Cerribacteria bacterium 'Amazon FNV 2010 28 9' TaxID=2081795 RepID=A0A317JMM6_9BACT|nr:MAG: hypothetical protein C5B42_04920 [Candidatus Cerribacteria bacterium 'Amazon FNV 2010 28 9']